MKNSKNNFNPVYYNIIDQIYHTRYITKKLSRFSLLEESINKLWPEGHPSKIIQIAGTNGKGSVCKFLEQGFLTFSRAGTFVNPHIFDYSERFSILGEKVSQNDIIEIWENKILPICIKQSEINHEMVHSFSEVSILIALSLFDKYDIKWAIMETGCGGRYERLTQLSTEAAVVTNVGNDHPISLGEKKWQRAIDKSGIIKKFKPFFTSDIDKENLEIFRQFCLYKNSNFFHITNQYIDNFKKILEKLFSSDEENILSSEYQVVNAALSLKILKYFYPDIKDEVFINKFSKIKYFGRFTEFEKDIFVDIAHNTDKIAALCKYIEKRFQEKKFIFVLGLSNSRDAKKIFAPLLDLNIKNIIITTSSYSSVDPNEIKNKLVEINKDSIPIEIELSPEAAYKKALSYKTNEIILLTGSTYMIDQALNKDKYLKFLNFSYGWRGREDNNN